MTRPAEKSTRDEARFRVSGLSTEGWEAAPQPAPRGDGPAILLLRLATWLTAAALAVALGWVVHIVTRC